MEPALECAKPETAPLGGIIKTALKQDPIDLGVFLGQLDRLIPEELSVHTTGDGGVLRVASRSGKYESKKERLAMVGDKDKPGEVEFSRAMFNRRSLKTPQGEFKVIAYEAPLLRKPKGGASRKGEVSRKVACDLVCISEEPPWRLVALEVKSRKNKPTNHRLRPAGGQGLRPLPPDVS